MATNWNSDSIKITDGVFVEVKANAAGVVLAQGDEVWFHDLHLTPDQATEIVDALAAGVDACLSAREGGAA